MTSYLSHNPVSGLAAVLWFFLCIFGGYASWNQTNKGFIWFLISLVTGGLGSIAWAIDYWMSWAAQQQRPLEPFEFFPR